METGFSPTQGILEVKQGINNNHNLMDTTLLAIRDRVTVNSSRQNPWKVNGSNQAPFQTSASHEGA
eukprot:1300232-Prorocentrum_lima.AAC.1